MFLLINEFLNNQALKMLILGISEQFCTTFFYDAVIEPILNHIKTSLICFYDPNSSHFMLHYEASVKFIESLAIFYTEDIWAQISTKLLSFIEALQFDKFQEKR